ncbi:MAG: TetR family transcriptional regulator C-terminal domain-containing protein [Geobacteraceae bacterium]|nr:TetR family transcriptional regulator C-terminal domain-containing protein [Geobacteraceae bacterium]
MMTKDTKSEILKAGLRTIARHGFNATGIETILKQANVPKGSFYHYFSSKKDFGFKVLDRFATGIDEIFTSYLKDPSFSPLVRLRNCTESLVARFEDNNCSIGCLVANLGQEMADQDEEFRQKLAEIFSSWLDHFECCLQEALDREEIPGDISPKHTARFFLSGFEGALLVSKVLKSSAPLHDFIDIFFERVLRQTP